MNVQTMISLTATGDLVCDKCFVDLQDENLGDFDPPACLRRRIPWPPDKECCCCHAAHPDWHRFGDVTPMEDPDPNPVCLCAIESPPFIDAEVACRFLGNPYSVDLNTAKGISEEAAQVLRQHDGTLRLNGLEQISPVSFSCLVRHWGRNRRLPSHLELNGLKTLTKGMAAELWGVDSVSIQLNGVEHLEEDAASAFAMAKDEVFKLELNGISTLTGVTALALARCAFNLSLDGLKDLSDEVAYALALHRGCLSLNGLTQLSDHAARVLSPKLMESISALSLDGLTELTDHQAHLLTHNETIIAYKSHRFLTRKFLSLNGLRSFSVEAAQALQRYSGDLNLDGLKSISEEVALILGGSSRRLSLNGLTEITDTAAARLASSGGELHLDGIAAIPGSTASALCAGTHDSRRLSLNGLTEITDTAAAGLASGGGELRLDGIAAISDSTASALCGGSQPVKENFWSLLSLDGLTEISDAALREFTRCARSLSLNGLRRISDTAFNWKCANDSKWYGTNYGNKDLLSLNGLEALTTENAWNLIRFGSRLMLNGIRNMDDSVTCILFQYAGSLYLDGVTTLCENGVKSAASLRASGGGEGRFSLMGLHSLSPSIFMLLQRICTHSHCYVILPCHIDAMRNHPPDTRRLSNLSTAMAEELAWYTAPLRLDGLAEISDPAAQALAKHREPDHENDEDYALYLNGLTALSERAASSLGPHQGYLCLDGLAVLSPECARLLVKGRVYSLSLNGLSRISPEMAVALVDRSWFNKMSGERWHFELGKELGMRPPDKASYSDMVRHLRPGRLHLDGVVDLSEESAMALGSSLWLGIYLNGLKAITDAAASKLAQLHGPVELNGLADLEPGVASALARLRGNLYLGGLSDISIETAEALSRHDGYLSLDGIGEITEELAIALSKHSGSLSFRSLQRISDEAAYAISISASILLFEGLQNVTVEAARHLMRHGKVTSPLDLVDIVYRDKCSGREWMRIANQYGGYSGGIADHCEPDPGCKAKFTGFAALFSRDIFLMGLALAELGYDGDVVYANHANDLMVRDQLEEGTGDDWGIARRLDGTRAIVLFRRAMQGLKETRTRAVTEAAWKLLERNDKKPAAAPVRPSETPSADAHAKLQSIMNEVYGGPPGLKAGEAPGTMEWNTDLPHEYGEPVTVTMGAGKDVSVRFLKINNTMVGARVEDESGVHHLDADTALQILDSSTGSDDLRAVNMMKSGLAAWKILDNQQDFVRPLTPPGGTQVAIPPAAIVQPPPAKLEKNPELKFAGERFTTVNRMLGVLRSKAIDYKSQLGYALDAEDPWVKGRLEPGATDAWGILKAEGEKPRSIVLFEKGVDSVPDQQTAYLKAATDKFSEGENPPAIETEPKPEGKDKEQLPGSLVGLQEGFALIPAGEVRIGCSMDNDRDGLPVEKVQISAFHMAKHLVTKVLWDEVRTWGLTHGYTDLCDGNGKAADHPVQSITWYDAVKWCNARSEMEGLMACYTHSGLVYRTTRNSAVACNWESDGYRLPTEAEWEMAARAGWKMRRFPFGDTITHSQANYYSSGPLTYDVSPTSGYHPAYTDDVSPYTSPVGSFAANGHGLYDMAGNVWEWCWDGDGESSLFFESSLVVKTNPRGVESGTHRVSRGGSWFNDASCCRVAYRKYGIADPSSSTNRRGFRVARSATLRIPVRSRAGETRMWIRDSTLSQQVEPLKAATDKFSEGTTPPAKEIEPKPEGKDQEQLPGSLFGLHEGFALIPAGFFQMGDALDGLHTALPAHTVQVSAFFMAKYLVTKADWDAVRAWGVLHGYTDLATGAGKAPDHPVQTVTWYDVVKWCNAKSEIEGLRIRAKITWTFGDFLSIINLV